jgi:hypothetical protein
MLQLEAALEIEPMLVPEIKVLLQTESHLWRGTESACYAVGHVGSSASLCEGCSVEQLIDDETN